MYKSHEMNLSFKHQENGGFAYNDSPNLTYQLMSSSSTFVSTLAEANFSFEASINPLHPTAAENSHFQTLLYPQ